MQVKALDGGQCGIFCLYRLLCLTGTYTRLQPMGRPNSLDCPTHLKGVMHMGRGRAKAKQTKVARQLKYNTPDMDLDSLQRELAPHGQGDRGPREKAANNATPENAD